MNSQRPSLNNIKRKSLVGNLRLSQESSRKSLQHDYEPVLARNSSLSRGKKRKSKPKKSMVSPSKVEVLVDVHSDESVDD